MNKSKLIFLLGLAIPALFAFKSLILPGPVVWGDAPFFYPEGLKELVAEPFAWTSRGNNFGGPNNLLWISPLMLVYGLLNKLFGTNNDVIIRILFYFPSIALAFIAPIVFVRKLGYSKVVQFFTSFLYGLNTYFLLLIDGGQVGVVLAYGLFPLALVFINGLLRKPTFLGFFLALLLLFLITVADPRFAAISVFAVLLWRIIEWFTFRKADEIKNLKFLVTLLLANILLSLYWLIPAFHLGNIALATDVSGLNFLSLLNPLFLFQPHWPGNEFGKISPPPFYFVGVPLLIFGSLLFSRRAGPAFGWAFLFLLFAFLVKGGSKPLGDWYNWLVSNTPFGFAFRDSTKFLAPAILFAGILIGQTAESLRKVARYRTALVGVVFVYLLFLVNPALLGNLNGVLSGRAFPEGFNLVYQKLRDDPQFFRTAWFPERHPFAFFTNEKPALDAKQLIDARPFASLNVGTLDTFNFLHNKEAIDWFGLLGIRYLIFSGDTRKAVLQEGEKKDWDNLLDLIEGTGGLEKTNWGVQFPVFKVPETKPHIFSVDKVIVVVGSDDIYQKLRVENTSFSIGNQGFLFLEDGRFDARALESIAPDAAIVVFNQKEKMDLAMSFVQKYFVSPENSVSSEWGVRNTKDYLRWKYELLKNGVDTKEFDYGRGIAFSSQEEERLEFDLEAPLSGTYFLGMRTLNGDSALPLETLFNGTEKILEQSKPNNFKWSMEKVQVDKGRHKLVIENPGGFQVVNTVALIPEEAWGEAQEAANRLVGHFKTIVTTDELQGLDNSAWDNSWRPVDFQEVNQSRYKVTIPEKGYWLIFTDSYNREWTLRRKDDSFSSYPFYSMVNGFYVDPSKWLNVEIVFGGQEKVRWGIYWSSISLLSFALIFLQRR